MTTPGYPWFVYPFFIILLGLITYIFIDQNKYKMYCLSVSLWLSLFLFVINIIHTPSVLWFLLAVYPILGWSILLFLGNRCLNAPIAWFGAILTIIYYGVLNIIFGLEYLWFIYPTFIVLWWPLVVYFIRKKNHLSFSIIGTLLICAFFIMVNVISSPKTIWAVYPIFVTLWWP